MDSKEFISEFIHHSLYRIEENTKRVNVCIHELSETEIWNRPNKNSNSVGNLILHLCGNITQYIISSLGKTEDKRQRDKEFSTENGYFKNDLLEKLNTTISKATNIIQNASEEELFRKRNVQGYFYSGIGIIVHVTEHYSYHTGQIIFWTKSVKNKDLAFYKDVDLNVKNEAP